MTSFIKEIPNVIREDFCKDFLNELKLSNLTPVRNPYNFDGIHEEFRNFSKYEKLRLLDKKICKAVDGKVQEYCNSLGFPYYKKNKLDGSSIVKLKQNMPLPLHYDPEITSLENLTVYDSKLEKLWTKMFKKLTYGRRHFTVLLYLHDCEGGELYFPKQKEIVKPEPGKLLIFPAYWTHPHTVLPCLDQDRYAYRFNYILKE